MDVFDYLGHLKRKCRDKQSFGKHRKKEWPVTTYPAYAPYTPNYPTFQAPAAGYWVGTKYYPNNTSTVKPKDDSRFDDELNWTSE